MKKSTILALVAAALVAGLTLGGMTTAMAAATGSDTAGLGLRLGPAFRDAGARMLDILAKATGKSVEDIQAERQSGKSVADIAKANNVDLDEVVAKVLDARKAVLADRVKTGAMTQDQADQAIARMQDRITDRVNSTETGPRNGQGRGAGGGRGMGGNGACGNCTATQ